MSSMPAKTFLADQNDLKLSIGLVTRLMARWSCSTMLFRYLTCRTMIGASPRALISSIPECSGVGDGLRLLQPPSDDFDVSSQQPVKRVARFVDPILDHAIHRQPNRVATLLGLNGLHADAERVRADLPTPYILVTDRPARTGVATNKSAVGTIVVLVGDVGLGVFGTFSIRLHMGVPVQQLHQCLPQHRLSGVGLAR